jgi:hypothetical protein
MNRYDILLGKKPTKEEMEELFLKAAWSNPNYAQWVAGQGSVPHTELRGQTIQYMHYDDIQSPSPQDPADLTAVQEEAIRAEYQRALEAITEYAFHGGGASGVRVTGDGGGGGGASGVGATGGGGGLIIDTGAVRNSQGLLTEIIPARNLTYEQHRMLYAGMSRVAREAGIVITVGGQRIGQVQSWEPSPDPENRPQPMQNLTLPSALERLCNGARGPEEYRNEYLATPVVAPEISPEEALEAERRRIRDRRCNMPSPMIEPYREPVGGRAIQWPPDMTVRLSQEIQRGIRPPTPEMLRELGLIRGEQENEADLLSRAAMLLNPTLDYNQTLLRTQEPSE